MLRHRQVHFEHIHSGAGGCGDHGLFVAAVEECTTELPEPGGSH